MEKLFHGHIKIISLVTGNMLFIFYNCYLWQTQDLKKKIAKHKADIKNPHNKIWSEHLRDCKQAEPHFRIFLFCYETNTELREGKEKRYIIW